MAMKTAKTIEIKQMAKVIADPGWALPEGKGGLTLETLSSPQTTIVALDEKLDWLAVGCVGGGCNGGGNFSLKAGQCKSFIWPVATYLEGTKWNYILYLEVAMSENHLLFVYWHDSERTISFPITVHAYLELKFCQCGEKCSCIPADKSFTGFIPNDKFFRRVPTGWYRQT